MIKSAVDIMEAMATAYILCRKGITYVYKVCYYRFIGLLNSYFITVPSCYIFHSNGQVSKATSSRFLSLAHHLVCGRSGKMPKM